MKYCARHARTSHETVPFIRWIRNCATRGSDMLSVPIQWYLAVCPIMPEFEDVLEPAFHQHCQLQRMVMSCCEVEVGHIYIEYKYLTNLREVVIATVAKTSVNYDDIYGVFDGPHEQVLHLGTCWVGEKPSVQIFSSLSSFLFLMPTDFSPYHSTS